MTTDLTTTDLTTTDLTTTDRRPDVLGPATGATALNDHDWQAAGQAWGHAAADWACLYEHYADDVTTVVLQRLGIGPGAHLLDIACGSGLTARRAIGLGARVSGIDASANLVDIARTRCPEADLRVGSMFDLPWPDADVDVAVSINGVWGGCDAALEEAYRVLRPGSHLALTFWGPGPPNDLRACFKAYARHAPPPHFTSMKQLNDIAHPGVAEVMLERAGFEVLETGGCISVVEWPDAEVAWRALSSTGPAVPALRYGDVEALRRDVLEAIEQCRDRHGIYRLRHDHRFVIARRP